MLRTVGVQHVAQNPAGADRATTRSGKPLSNCISAAETPRLLQKAKFH
jgi:hypothetical protein